jgi:hypothetical protein
VAILEAEATASELMDPSGAGWNVPLIHAIFMEEEVVVSEINK